MTRAIYSVAVLLLTSAFWLSGVFKALDFPAAIAEVRGLTGLEPAEIIAGVVIAVQLGGSLLLLIGGRAAILGALALGGFTIAATLLAHSWWTKEGVERIRDFNIFWEHMGLVGGFMLAALAAQKIREKV